MNKKILFCVFALTLIFFSCKKSNNTLKVYAIIHDEETKALLDAFSKESGIKAEYVHTTTGALISKIKEERDNPQGDILLGGAASYHIDLAKDGLLEEYKSPVAKDFPESLLSLDSTWTPFCALIIGVGVNEKLYKEKFPNKKYPKTWDDLLDPAFKGQIVLTDPLFSSTGYLFLQNQLQRLGDKDGWKYLEELKPLVGNFPKSGSAPARLIGTNEFPICVSYLHAIAKYASLGYKIIPLSIEDCVTDMDCISIIKGTKNLENSKKFVDFILSTKGSEIMSKISFTTPINPNCSFTDGVVEFDEIKAIDYDKNKASLEREYVLKKWEEIQ